MRHVAAVLGVEGLWHGLVDGRLLLDCDHRGKPPTTSCGTLAATALRGPARSMTRRASRTRLAFRMLTCCGRCGARRVDDQLGLEATPDLYVERLVAVRRREVWRVLRADGTLFLNLGDSYAGSSAGAGARPRSNRPTMARSTTAARAMAPGLKPKDLVGVPWRVAFALQADGWYLRSGTSSGRSRIRCPSR